MAPIPFTTKMLVLGGPAQLLDGTDPKGAGFLIKPAYFFETNSWCSI